MRKTILLLSFLAALIVPACAQQSQQEGCNKLAEPSIGIAFCAPSGWTVTKQTGAKFQGAYSEAKDGVKQTISFDTDSYDMTLEEYVKAGLDYLKKHFKDKGYSSVLVENQSEFAGRSVKGFRFAYIPEKDGRKFRIIQYAFPGKGNMKIVITAVTSLSDKDKSDKLFDDAMKTFEVTK
jgi:hypothetical protein